MIQNKVLKDVDLMKSDDLFFEFSPVQRENILESLKSDILFL